MVGSRYASVALGAWVARRNGLVVVAAVPSALLRVGRRNVDDDSGRTGESLAILGHGVSLDATAQTNVAVDQWLASMADFPMAFVSR